MVLTRRPSAAARIATATVIPLHTEFPRTLMTSRTRSIIPQPPTHLIHHGLLGPSEGSELSAGDETGCGPPPLPALAPSVGADRASRVRNPSIPSLPSSWAVSALKRSSSRPSGYERTSPPDRKSVV